MGHHWGKYRCTTFNFKTVRNKFRNFEILRSCFYEVIHFSFILYYFILFYFIIDLCWYQWLCLEISFVYCICYIRNDRNDNNNNNNNNNNDYNNNNCNNDNNNNNNDYSNSNNNNNDQHYLIKTIITDYEKILLNNQAKIYSDQSRTEKVRWKWRKYGYQRSRWRRTWRRTYSTT